RGFGDEAAESRKASGRPDECGRSKTGKSPRWEAPERAPISVRGSVIGPAPSPSVRDGRLRGSDLVADPGRKADLLADPVVAVRLELVAQLLAAAHDHPAIEEHVDELRLHVVEH